MSVPGGAAAPDGDVPFVEIDRVTRRFGAVAAVDQLSLDIRRGELFALLGASGCGKSTLLRLLAGFEQPDAGAIRLDGVDMAGTPAYARPVNMMFQSYALFPHMTVAGNIGFGLRQEGVRGAELARRVGESMALLKLDGLERRRPHELSGGQRQRVALARALIKRPKLLLLDEPLAALDKKLREHTQFELVNIQESVGITFVVVTHDQEEAMTLASRIGVMDHGHILQVGTPTEIYESPATRFVADFIGSVNLFEGRVAGQQGGVVQVDCPGIGAPVLAAHAAPVAAGTPVTVAVRPEKIAIAPAAGDAAGEADNRLAGRVDEIAYSGTHSTYLVRVGGDGARLKVTMPNLTRHTAPITWEDEVRLAWPAQSGVVLLS